MSSQRKEYGVENRLPGIGDEGLEGRFVVVDVALLHQIAREGVDGVFGRPARHDKVETHDQHRGQDPDIADHAPPFAKRAVGSDRILTRGCTDRELGNHERNAHQQDAQQIDQEEGSASIFTGQIGESPDVTQPHGRTCGYQHCADLAAKSSSFDTFHLSHLT